MELEPSAYSDFKVEEDRRPRVEDPLPVKLIAVADVRLPMQAGLERESDAFYVGLLGFERDANEVGVVYWADNYSVRLEVVEGLIRREGYRPLALEVMSLAETEQKLIEAELEYSRQKGLMAGTESLLVQDPTGNWVEITEYIPVR